MANDLNITGEHIDNHYIYNQAHMVHTPNQALVFQGPAFSGPTDTYEGSSVLILNSTAGISKDDAVDDSIDGIQAGTVVDTVLNATDIELSASMTGAIPEDTSITIGSSSYTISRRYGFEIYLVDEANATNVALERDVDYRVFLSVEGRSRALLEKEDFDGELIDGIIVLTEESDKLPSDFPFEIRCSYRTLDAVDSIYATTISELIDNWRTFSEDRAGTDENNHVRDEEHYVNLPDNKQVIVPFGGPFFGHGVEVKNAESVDLTADGSHTAGTDVLVFNEDISNYLKVGDVVDDDSFPNIFDSDTFISSVDTNHQVTLTKSIKVDLADDHPVHIHSVWENGTDYFVTGTNIDKVKIAECSSGVFNYIVLASEDAYVGRVKISYRAFGGGISRRDFDQLRGAVASLLDYIKANGISLSEHIDDPNAHPYLDADTVDTHHANDNELWDDDATLATKQKIKAYVDAVGQGLRVKNSCALATAGQNIDFSGGTDPGTVDGVGPGNQQRILAKDQDDAAENGIYYIPAAADGGDPTDPTTWQRAEPSNEWGEVRHAFTFIRDGDVNAHTGWVSTVEVDNGTIDVDPITWTQFSSPGFTRAGTNLEKSGDVLSVVSNPVVESIQFNSWLIDKNGFRINSISDDTDLGGDNAGNDTLATQAAIKDYIDVTTGQEAEKSEVDIFDNLDISGGKTYVILNNQPVSHSAVQVTPYGGPMQLFDVDYYVEDFDSTGDGTKDSTRVGWDGRNLADELTDDDILMIAYEYQGTSA